MTINGIDINSYGARQHNVSMAYAAVTNSSEWIEGSLNPLMLKGAAGFKTIKVTVIISGASRQNIWDRGSNMIAELMSPAEIKLDGFNHRYCVVLKNPEQAEASLNRWHKTTLELIGYEYGAQESISQNEDTTSFTVVNAGNIETPAILELTPTIGKVNLTITGLTRDRITGESKNLTVSNLVLGKKIIIDGETGLITQDGANKYPEITEMWDLPSLLPGANVIKLDKDGIKVTLKHKPRYL